MVTADSLESILRHERSCWEEFRKLKQDQRPDRALTEWAGKRLADANVIALDAMRQVVEDVHER